MMQEFIPGKELCTHSTVRDGELRLHCCSDSSAFQINYENVENPQIREWVQHFIKSLGTFTPAASTIALALALWTAIAIISGVLPMYGIDVLTFQSQPI